MLREERFPRELEIEFIERGGERKLVILRCNNINVGARINDNISDPDYYRYHDIFHLSYAVFLGWSPVIRSLLRCKRKSDPNLDENEDGARSVIIVEALSAIVFSSAINLRYFADAAQVDYDLLKNIAESFEVTKSKRYRHGNGSVRYSRASEYFACSKRTAAGAPY